MFTAQYGRYIPVRQVVGTRTARYRAVPPKIDRRRSISTVGDRLKGEIDCRRSIEGEIDHRRSIEREKKGGRKKRKKKKKKEKRRKRIPIACARSSPMHRHRSRTVASARTPLPLAGGEKDRDDTCQTSPRSVPPDPQQLATSDVSGQTQQPIGEQYPLLPDSWQQAAYQGRRNSRPVNSTP
ncbi:hypothetical protein BHE74_00003869 [Ensete ventricosum]|nr:hypothetical protein BHE74_00003869 [Ensete ventricosum]